MMSDKVRAMMERKVDFRQLKEAGSYPDLHEKLARELAREYERELDSDYVVISWASQERAQNYFNAHGFEATLDHMLEIRTRNEEKRMSFMQPQVYESDYLLLDGPVGGEVIPCDVVDYHPTREEIDWQGKSEGFDVPAVLRDYCENRKLWSIERKHGWVGCMSAPGYMDRTAWIADDSEEKVRIYLETLYGDDE